MPQRRSGWPVVGELPDGVPVVRLAPWTGPWADDDPDANFKADIATYSLADPLLTLQNMADNLDVPVGSLARYVLAKWASGGAEGLLELGPSTVERMRGVIAQAEDVATDEARLAGWTQLTQMLAWLGHGIDSPDTTYPEGGGVPI